MRKLNLLGDEDEQYWHARGGGHDPGADDSDGRVALRPQGDAPDRVDDGQVAVQWQQNQGEHRAVGGHVNQVLDDLAPDLSEGPADGVVHGRGGDTDGDKQEVGEGQVLKEMEGEWGRA